MKLGLFAAIFAAAVAPGAIGAGELLSKHDCEIIASYEREYEREADLPFPERFAKMVHQREYCFDAGKVCQVPLMKRQEDFYVVVRGKRHFASDGLAGTARKALIKVAEQLRDTTGLTPLFTKPSGASSFVYLVFVDREIAEARFDEYVASWIAPDSVASNADGKLELQSIFRNFLEGNQPCMVINHLTDHNTIERAQIWIRADLDDALMQQCIAEEFYNSMGVSEGVEVPSIFDFRFSHEKGDVVLSDFDLLLLKILYWREIPIGASRTQTRKLVERVLAKDCKAKPRNAGTR